MDDTGPPSPNSVPGDKLLSVSMDDWPAIGGQVHIDISPQKTVLVGKNSAGKSILLDGIENGAATAALNPRIAPLGPGSLCFNALIAGLPIAFSYHWYISDAMENSDESVIEWEERCWNVTTENEYWRVSKGSAIIANGATLPLPPETGLLALRGTPSIDMPAEWSGLRRLLRGTHLVPAGVPRTERVRFEMELRRISDLRLSRGRRRDDRLSDFLGPIATWYEINRDLFDHFVTLCRRVEIASDISVEITHSSRSTGAERGRKQQIARISFDGTDCGLLSDGTLRIAEILVCLVDPQQTMLLVEEPETAIHPGLLKRLLAEIDAHTMDRQVVISTHSPIVVDWSRPSEIRFVERIKGRTTARGLNPDEVASLTTYLHDDGTLAEFVFGRSSE